MTLRSFFLAFAFLIFTLLPFGARAAEQIGTVVEIEGTATVTSGTLTKPLNVDEPIYLNDALTTFANSRILVLLADDTEITLGENATLTIDRYVFDPDNAAPPQGTFSVLRGSFVLVSGLISKVAQPDVKVNTSYGTIGLRGTTVWGGVLDQEYGVLVLDGEVDVTNDAGTTRVPKGLGTFMKNRRELPRPPKAWATAKTDRAVASIALKRQEMVKLRVEQHKEQNALRREKIKELRQQKKGDNTIRQQEFQKIQKLKERELKERAAKKAVKRPNVNR